MRAEAERRYTLTEQARFEMSRRGITESDVAHVMVAPEQQEAVRPNRWVYQSRIDVGDSPKTYLLRVVVDLDRDPHEVVTVYRTSKVHKYWR